MELTHLKQNDIHILKISGKLDTNTSQEFEKELMAIVNSGEKKILLDCKDLDYISSAGLRVLLLAAKVIKSSDGKVMLAGLKEHVSQVFEIAGFTGIFPIYQSLNEAVKN